MLELLKLSSVWADSLKEDLKLDWGENAHKMVN